MGQFKRHLELGIRPIPIREKHPQTNGKIEKFFDCYDKHRDVNSLEEFIYWYNNISTRAWTPCSADARAFWGRLPEEVKVGLAAELFER